jgi:hypothetical protein
VLELIAAGWSFDELVAEYPGLTVEDIRAWVAFAKVVLAGQRVFQGERDREFSAAPLALSSLGSVPLTALFTQAPGIRVRTSRVVAGYNPATTASENPVRILSDACPNPVL